MSAREISTEKQGDGYEKVTCKTVQHAPRRRNKQKIQCQKDSGKIEF